AGLGPGEPLRPFYRRAAEALVAGIEHEVLPGGDGALRRVEVRLDRAVAAVEERARLVGLAVARLRRAAPSRARTPAWRRARDPVHVGGDHDVREKGRMIRALCDDERVAVDPLLDDVPGRVRAVRDAAYTQAVPLAERVERQAVMRAELDAVDADDRAG